MGGFPCARIQTNAAPSLRDDSNGDREDRFACRPLSGQQGVGEEMSCPKMVGAIV